MMEYFNDNMASFWFAVGFLLLIIEALAFGFSTGFILFVGLAGLLTGGLLWFALIPATWVASIGVFGVSSVVISAALWKPLKKMQGDEDIPAKDNSSDLIGLKFRLDKDISITNPGVTRYSGIEWKVEIDFDSSVDTISAGDTVVVTSVDAGKFRVTTSPDIS